MHLSIAVRANRNQWNKPRNSCELYLEFDDDDFVCVFDLIKSSYLLKLVSVLLSITIKYGQ